MAAFAGLFHMLMETLSRRTLIIAAAITLAPQRRLRAAIPRERTAESLIATAVNEGRLRLAPELPALIRDPQLDVIARERSEAMVRGAPFAHQDEHGRYPAIEKMRARYSRYGAMGENLMMDFEPGGGAYDPALFAGRAVKSWFDSEGHRQNILSPAFTHSGIGVAASRTIIYATQVFWGPPVQRPRSRAG
jgi:uncharacterized protein YkwD